MNPLVVAFVAPPQSQRNEVYDKVKELLKLDNKIKAISINYNIMENLENFESFYKAGLDYMISDMETRSIARKHNANVLLYRVSLYDVAGYCNTSKIIGPEYKKMIEKAVFTHVEFFPINLLFYCEPLKNDQNDPNFMAKEHLKLRVDNSILNIIERVDFERVVLDTIENRANYIVKILREKLLNL